MVTKYSDKDKKFNKAKELSNTFSLRKYKTSNYPEVTNVVDHLFNEMVNVYRLSLTRPSSIKNLNHHIEFFVLNLYNETMKLRVSLPGWKMVLFFCPKNITTNPERRYPNELYRSGLPYIKFRLCRG